MLLKQCYYSALCEVTVQQLSPYLRREQCRVIYLRYTVRISLASVHNYYMFTHVSTSILNSFISAALILAVVTMSFLVFEPTVSRAIVDVHKVTQSVTAEISFLATPADVVMSPALAGLTGGSAAGTTTVRVLTNNDTGYNMTIAFSSSTAMGRNGGGGVIANYTPASAGVPDFNFANEVYGQFAYTVSASTTADLDQSFKDTGAACNSSTADAVGKCWLDPDTVAETIINRTTATLSSGATTSISFRVHIPSSPLPAISEGTYVATATLTALTN